MLWLCVKIPQIPTVILSFSLLSNQSHPVTQISIIKDISRLFYVCIKSLFWVRISLMINTGWSECFCVARCGTFNNSRNSSESRPRRSGGDFGRLAGGWLKHVGGGTADDSLSVNILQDRRLHFLGHIIDTNVWSNNNNNNDRCFCRKCDKLCCAAKKKQKTEGHHDVKKRFPVNKLDMKCGEPLISVILNWKYSKEQNII